MKNKNFACFILTNRKVSDILTVNSLRRQNYTGNIYIITDDDCSYINDYKQEYGKEFVITFSKNDVAKTFDICDNFEGNKVIIYARNACFTIAEELGLTHFLELDDDYRSFDWRYDDDGTLRAIKINCLDDIFDYMIDYLDSTNIITIAFGQAGDYIGGAGSQLFSQKIKRKVMNTFFCKVDRKFTFTGRFNEDASAYTSLGSRGNVFITICDIGLVQRETQAASGGLTDVYKTYGTYTKSFYSVMQMPSAVRVAIMQTKHVRIHHSVDWEHCVPKIISDRFKL